MMMRAYFGACLVLTAACAFSQFDSGLMVELGRSNPSTTTAKTISQLKQAEQTQKGSTTPEFSQYTNFFGVRNERIFSSEDPRRGFGFSLGVGRKDPKLKWGREGELIWEGYFLQTDGENIYEFPGSTILSWGVLATARYRIKLTERDNFFYDIGFGVQWVNHISHDLRLANNTTPIGGFGIESKTVDNKAWIWGLRFLHVSNGGRTNPNPGQNMLQLIVGIKY